MNCTEIMRERLLNPKKLNIELEALPITIIDGVSYRTFTKQYTFVDDGSCQCYKDCDCSSRAGIVTKTEITWYRNIKFDGTDKCFYSEPYTRCCKSLAYEFETLKLNNMKEVIEKLNEGLKDPEYRQGWIANIAMAQIDCERWYREENNKVGKYLNANCELKTEL